MKTMANLKFMLVKLSALFLIVVFFLDNVSARNCAEVERIMNCNECIRCGGHWCNQPDKQGKHCSEHETTDWCPNDRETLSPIAELATKGVSVSPAYAETTAFVRVPNKIALSHVAKKEPHVKITIVNTTQNFNFDVKSQTTCSSGNCTTSIHAVASTDFCSPTSRAHELVNVRVVMEQVDEEVMIKYHVPCACACNKKVEKSAEQCNGRGDYSCGVCSCHNGWVGEFCEEKVCKSNRGDLQCTNPARNDVECSGNGYCDACSTCECYNNLPGSQYFDRDNYCADLCMTTNDCDECLSNPLEGRICEDCLTPAAVIIEPYNRTTVREVDTLNRKVWVTCNETLPDGCYIEYAAMKDENGDVHVMVMRLCETVIAAYVPGPVNVTIPIVLGLVGVLAAAAAVGGFLLHKNRTPPLPMTDPHYQNIGAEDCVGENPLYKPPTSSFKNPTYGKW